MKDRYWVLLILILAVPSFWALFVPGFYGASDDLHIAWLYELDRIIKIGQIPPRFVPDLSFGFGYPLFNFVFPLPFYMGEIIHFFGFSFVDSIKAVFFLSIPFSAISMFLLLRHFVSRPISLVGSLIYMYAPYRAVDIYIRGAIGEAISFIFLPIIILSIFKLAVNVEKKWIGIGALSLASLVLSHNITAYMFLPLAFVLGSLLTIFLPARKRTLINLALMFLLGFLASMFFWLPAILESRLMKYDTVFNFVDHFPTIRQLFTPYWGYGGSVPGPGDGMSFFLGIPSILMLLVGLFVVITSYKKLDIKEKILISWSFLCIGLAVILMNHRSIFIWNSVPMLPLFQFPWRFLIVTTFLIPVLVVILKNFPANRLIILLLIPFILVTSWGYFRPQDFLGRRDDYYLNRYIPYPYASGEYLKIQEEYLRLPKELESRPDKNYPLILPQEGVFNLIKYNDLHFVFEVSLDKETLVSINKYYFPGWKVKLDGKNYQAFSGKPFGQITIQVPVGKHRIEAYFEETNFRRVLDFASLAAILVSLLFVLNLKKEKAV